MSGSVSTSDKLDWLQLYRSVGIGPTTFFKLLERFGTARRAFEELPRLAARSGDAERYRRCRRDEAEAELEALDEIGARLLAWGEPGYPERLAGIADPPPLVTVLGRAELLCRPGVALVGARNASAVNVQPSSPWPPVTGWVWYVWLLSTCSTPGVAS